MEIRSPLIDATKKKTADIILNLTEPFLDRGRMLWIDNCFNFPDLAHFLKTKIPNVWVP
jgi:hypothetical protein